jgi:hypothetical protein
MKSMLNYHSMQRIPLYLQLILILAWMSLPLSVHAQGSGSVITGPTAGQALQGVVTITGTSAVPGFASAEISFAYVDDPTGTWFFIDQTTTPVADGTLATWDTSTLTDGDYTLRLSVTLQNGTTQNYDVPGLRVRNYTPVETATPTLALPTDTPPPGATAAPTITLTPTISPIPPTITPLPPNPVVVTPTDITFNIIRGVLIAVAVFAVVGLVFAIARLRR